MRIALGANLVIRQGKVTFKLRRKRHWNRRVVVVSGGGLPPRGGCRAGNVDGGRVGKKVAKIVAETGAETGLNFSKWSDTPDEI